MPESQYSIGGIKNGISILFLLYRKDRLRRMSLEVIPSGESSVSPVLQGGICEGHGKFLCSEITVGKF